MNQDVNAISTSASVIGFLQLGVTWGFVIGYFLADLGSKSIGYFWYANPYPNYFDYSVRCFVAGPIVGLVAGLIVDIAIQDKRLRKRLRKFGLIGLIFVVVLYALMAPTMLTVRE